MEVRLYFFLKVLFRKKTHFSLKMPPVSSSPLMKQFSWTCLKG
jgi:hypothetical protein